MKKYTLLLIAAGLCLASCNEKKTVDTGDSNKIVLGDNLYIDANDVIHSKFGCDYTAEKNGTRPIECIIPVEDIGVYSWSFCSQCINEEVYNEIKSKGRWRADNIDLLYYDLYINGLTQEKRSEFRRNLQDYNNRNALYGKLKYKKKYWTYKKDDFMDFLNDNFGFEYI